MNIKIDIELTPQELRHFIGLPDVAGLQNDMIEFVREKVSKGVENVDVDALKEGIQSSRMWKRLMAVIGPEVSVDMSGRSEPRKPRRRSRPPSTNRGSAD